MIQRYLVRISGPLLNRIDLHVWAPAVKYKEFSEKSALVRIHRGGKHEAGGECQEHRRSADGHFAILEVLAFYQSGMLGSRPYNLTTGLEVMPKHSRLWCFS